MIRNVDVNATSCMVYISNTTRWMDGWIEGYIDRIDIVIALNDIFLCFFLKNNANIKI